MNARHTVLTLVALAIPFASDVTAQPSGQAAKKKTGYAPVNGLKMYYEISGEGEPAVYIHPVLSHCGLTPALTGNRRWIAMDLQGHGRTADIDRPMTCEQHADDIAALLKYLKIERADLFGDSFGGTIAVMMAVRHPSSFAEWFHTAARSPLTRALPRIAPQPILTSSSGSERSIRRWRPIRSNGPRSSTRPPGVYSPGRDSRPTN